MTAPQPSPAQRLLQWCLPGVLCAPGGGGGLTRLLGSPQRSRLPAGAWPALETENHRWHGGLCLPSQQGDLPTKGAGLGVLGLASTGFKNGANEERRKESKDSRKLRGLRGLNGGCPRDRPTRNPAL